MADLEIKNLHVRVEDREILKGVDLDVSKGEVHALMGPNGSGKSTLANTIMGHPGYEITDGQIAFRGDDITEHAEVAGLDAFADQDARYRDDDQRFGDRHRCDPFEPGLPGRLGDL